MFDFESIKRIWEDIRVRPRGTIIIVIIILALVACGYYGSGFLSEKGKQAAINPEEKIPHRQETHGDRSPAIVAGDNNQISINYDNNSEDMPVVVVRPVSFEPYFPSSPQAPGQFKTKIVAELILKNKKIANNIRVKFDIEDGTSRRVDSEEWNNISKQKPLTLSMAYGDIKHIRWTPDIPNAIKEIAQNREKPFILRLLVIWEDMEGNQYRLMSYSELRYNEISNKYYFDERENKYI